MPHGDQGGVGPGPHKHFNNKGVATRGGGVGPKGKKKKGPRIHGALVAKPPKKPVKNPWEGWSSIKHFYKTHKWQKGTKGKKNPTIDPFMTADDMMQYGQSRAQYEGQLQDMDNELANQQAQNQYDKDQISWGEVRDRSSATWDTASRGLESSSVRDAELDDISATAAIRRKFLDDSLTIQSMEADAKKEMLRSNWENFYMKGLNQKMVQNAKDATEDVGVWKKKPTKGKWVSNGWKKPTKPKQKVVQGTTINAPNSGQIHASWANMPGAGSRGGVGPGDVRLGVGQGKQVKPKGTTYG